MINFVSNLPAHLRTGGFSAMCANAFQAARDCDDVHFVGPINPPPIISQRVRSAVLRKLGGTGDFYGFSQARLRIIAGQVHLACRRDANMDFFHGFTPWILTRPERPYIAWSDCTFDDYMSIYHDRARFRAADIARIMDSEARWLRAAQLTGFTSEWAANRAAQTYGITRSKIRVFGIFGEIDVPETDQYEGSKDFLFVSTNFAAKGGPAVLNAFRQIWDRHKDARLLIIGAVPPQNPGPGVFSYGMLRKENRQEFQLFRRALAKARALVHPTLQDIAPLILVEAAYFGCPAISSARYAIPELITDDVSGILINNPECPAAIAAAMTRILEDGDLYLRMRAEAWTRSRQRNSKQAFFASVRDALGQVAGYGKGSH